MTTTLIDNNIERIGVVAGEVWQCLETQGQQSVSKLVQSIDWPRDTVMQAIGWLARENKVVIQETSRGRVVCLNISN